MKSIEGRENNTLEQYKQGLLQHPILQQTLLSKGYGSLREGAVSREAD